MTVVRRELPLSRRANRPRRGRGRRIVLARALQSCLRRRTVATPQEAHAGKAQAATPSGVRVMAAQTKPTSSRATAATATVGRLPWPTRCR